MNAQPFPEQPMSARLSAFAGRQASMIPWMVAVGVGFFAFGFWSGAEQVVVSEDAIKASLTEAMPDLKISSINCRVEPGRCEVVAGDLVFMTDYAGSTIFFRKPNFSKFAEKEWRAISENQIQRDSESQ